MQLDNILKKAVERRASDLHLLVGKPPIVRIDGGLVELDGKNILSEKEAEQIILGILTDVQKKKFLKNRELDISYTIKQARFRVNCHFEQGHMGMVARIITHEIPSMEDIGMPEIGYELTRIQQGFILVTGPTGCGKSTTLAAMIRLINEERKAHIVTLEDPIEFVHESIKSLIRQRQLGSDFLSFKEALKHVVRQDPDVILVGEMRDLDTIASAITLAETGHLVLATLHTNSAAQTIDRVIDVFPPYQQDQIRLQLSMSLRGVIAQRLLPRAGGGRVAVREILINTPAVGNMIRENKIAQIPTAIQTGLEEGMQTLVQDIKKLLKNKLINEEVASPFLE